MAPDGRADPWFEEVYASAADDPEPDLFALPAAWAGRFAIVVEALTVQSLPPEAHRQAIAAITRCVAPGGHLLVRTAVRADEEPADARSWPLRHAELRWFEADGLGEVGRRRSGDRLFLHLDYRRPQEREAGNSRPDRERLRHA